MIAPRPRGFVLVLVLAMRVVLSLLAGGIAATTSRLVQQSQRRADALQDEIDMASTRATVLYMLGTQRMTIGGLTVDNLVAGHGAEALVIVSACDVRVNPRQGLKWFLRYRSLGGPAELWFDPLGAHDCWGAGMPRTALVDWTAAALERRRARSAA